MSWENQNFRELGFLGRGKSRHRPRNDESLYGGDYPMIQTGEVKAANFYLNSFSQTYNEKGLAQSKLWEPNTLCITIAANIAETAILGMKACFPDSIIGFIADEEKSDVRFIKYFFDIYKESMQRISQGATQDNLSLEKLLTFEVPTPPLKTQKRIADILSAYDDLIENNLKRIKLLEQAAQNIYKEWFVNLRFPNYENTPIDEETRLPVGWEEKKLSEFIDFKEGPGLRNWQFRTEGIPFLNIRMMSSGNLNFNSVKYLDIDEVERKYAHFLLNEFDHIVSTSGTLGKVVTIRKSHLPLCLNTSIIRFRPKQISIGKWYIKRKISSTEFLDEMKSFATGSAQLNFGPKHLNMMNIIVPIEEIGKEYERITNPMELKIISLLDYNQKLKSARDILLPRLMNRTIQV